MAELLPALESQARERDIDCRRWPPSPRIEVEPMNTGELLDLLEDDLEALVGDARNRNGAAREVLQGDTNRVWIYAAGL